MNDLSNWKELTKYLYRYVISANVCYEIHIRSYKLGTDQMQATANLYIVGEWNTAGGVVFEREMLEENITVADCLNAAVEDNAENNT